MAIKSIIRIAACVVLILALPNLSNPPVEAQQFQRWNDYNLRDWILSQRYRAAADVEAELAGWPDWPPRCFDLTVYLYNVGTEFLRRCGPVVKDKANTVVGDCIKGSASPIELMRRLPICLKEAATVPFWVAEIAQCTVTSYITAAEMSEQDREDMVKLVNGASELKTLLGLANIFEAGALADVAKSGMPRSLQDAAALVTKAREIGKQETERAERIAKMESHFKGIRSALGTFDVIRRHDIRAIHDLGVETLEDCDPTRAEDLFIMAQLEMYRHVSHMRANLVVAEKAYYCQGRKAGFGGWKYLQQQEFRDGVGIGVGILRNRWTSANSDHEHAVRAYAELLHDPRRAPESLEKARRLKVKVNETIEGLASAANACLASCGELRDGCTLPTDTLQQAIVTERAMRCADAALVEEQGLDRKLEELESIGDLRASAEFLTGGASPAIRAKLRGCDTDRARAEFSQLEQRVASVARADRYPQCYRESLDALRRTIAGCEVSCASAGVSTCDPTAGADGSNASGSSKQDDTAEFDESLVRGPFATADGVVGTCPAMGAAIDALQRRQEALAAEIDVEASRSRSGPASAPTVPKLSVDVDLLLGRANDAANAIAELRDDAGRVENDRCAGRAGGAEEGILALQLQRQLSELEYVRGVLREQRAAFDASQGSGDPGLDRLEDLLRRVVELRAEIDGVVPGLDAIDSAASQVQDAVATVFSTRARPGEEGLRDAAIAGARRRLDALRACSDGSRSRLAALRVAVDGLVDRVGSLTAEVELMAADPGPATANPAAARVDAALMDVEDLLAIADAFAGSIRARLQRARDCVSAGRPEDETEQPIDEGGWEVPERREGDEATSGGSEGWKAAERVDAGSTPEPETGCSGPRPGYEQAMRRVEAAIARQDLDRVLLEIGSLDIRCPGDASRLERLRELARAIARADADANAADMRSAVSGAREHARRRAEAWASALGTMQGVLAEMQRAESPAPIGSAGGSEPGRPADDSPPSGTAPAGSGNPAAGDNRCLVDSRTDISPERPGVVWEYYVQETSVPSVGYEAFKIQQWSQSSSGPPFVPGSTMHGPYPSLAAARASLDRLCPPARRATDSIRTR